MTTISYTDLQNYNPDTGLQLDGLSPGVNEIDVTGIPAAQSLAAFAQAIHLPGDFALLPDLLNALNLPDALSLSEVSLNVYSGAAQAAIMSLSPVFTTEAAWSVFDVSGVELNIHNLGIFFTIYNAYNPYVRHLGFGFTGQLTLQTASSDVTFDIEASLPGLTVTGALAPDDSIPLGAFITKYLLAGHLSVFDQLTVTQVNFNADPLGKTFAIELEIADPWTIFTVGSNPFTLEDLTVHLEKSDTLTAEISGYLRLFDEVLLVASVAYQDPGWVLSGNIGAYSEVPLTDLFSRIFGQSLPDGFPAIFLSNLGITLQTGAGASLAVTGEVRVDVGDSTNSPFLTYDLTIAVNYQPGQPQPFSGSLSGTLDLSEQSINISALTQALTLGPVSAPTSIDFPLLSASINYEFETKDCVLTCSIDSKNLGLADAVEIEIEIDLLHQTAGGYECRFHGHLSLNDLEFDLIFDKTGSGQVFIAAYNDPDGNPIVIKDFVALISADAAQEVPPSLSFTLKEALLAHQGAPSSKWLFGLDIDGGLNLSRLDLPDLPLLGDVLFPPDQTLQLAFQLLAASQSFTQAEVSALAALLPPGSINFPAQDISGLVMNTTLRLGGQPIQLALGMGSDTSLTGGAPISPAPVNNAPQAQPLAQASNTPGGGSTQWVNVQKTFGPLHVEQVGVKYAAPNISVLLNASLTAGGLTIDLQGLKATSPLSPLSPTFSLDGLGIAYQNGDFEIAGAFLKMGSQFAGLAILRASSFTLSAIGAYGKTGSGDVSLFLYATLDKPLGGPAFFFVTGLAAGFGYNRALVAPTIDQVADFPLITQAVNGAPAPAAGQDSLTAALSSLQQYVPITVGQTFLAVGVKFNSFKLIDSFALLVVQFGNRAEIDLLGLSTLIVPTPQDIQEGQAPPPPSLAEAQLAIKATFLPDDGFLGVLGQLTAASYIIDHNCHLTGGFAFYSWLSGPHAGDFVLTLGGYHPKFNVPAHYPQQVPRLGINWQVNGNLSITGQEYYALTAHALMAGGSLSANYQNGSVSAWFNAGADFLLTWQPYHYEADLYVSLGARVTIHFLGTHHLSFEAGADLNLWGPPFGGHANIHLKVCGFKVSFDVDFGSGHVGARPIDWLTFKQAFLPKDEQVCSIAVQGGLLRQIGAGNDERWIVNPQSFTLVTNTVIPAQSAAAGGYSPSGQGAIAVQPMGVTADKLTSTHSITIMRDTTDATADFIYQPALKQVPSGMWGAPTINKDGALAKPDVNAVSFVEKALCGLSISPKAPTPSGQTHSIPRSNLGYETFEYGIKLLLHPVWVTLARQTFNFDETLTQNQDAGVWMHNIQNSILKNEKRDTLLQELGLGNAVIDFGQPVDQFSLSAPQVTSI